MISVFLHGASILQISCNILQNNQLTIILISVNLNSRVHPCSRWHYPMDDDPSVPD